VKKNDTDTLLFHFHSWMARWFHLYLILLPLGSSCHQSTRSRRIASDDSWCVCVIRESSWQQMPKGSEGRSCYPKLWNCTVRVSLVRTSRGSGGLFHCLC
jgi:hypothetical protein